MYNVFIHRKAKKFLESLTEKKLREKIKETIFSLSRYPYVLRELDVEKLVGMEGTYRVRIGDIRIIFVVDKNERTIYVTHIGYRGSIYRNI